MSVLKDLLYTKGNESLDITRVSILFTVVAFWCGVFSHQYQTKEFDPIAVGGGVAAIFAASAGWLHYRQKQEGSNGPAD